MAYFWQADGEDDQIIIPALALDEIILTLKGPFSDDIAHISGPEIYFNLSDPQLVIWQNDYATNWTASVNGGARVNAQGVYIGDTTKKTVSLKRSSEVSATNIYISSGGNDYYSTGNWYDIKVLRNNVIQAHYDLTLGHAQDISGNNRHATIQGGTWVNEGGAEPQPIQHTLSLSETVNLSETFTKRASRFKTLNDSITATDAIAKRLSVVVADSVALSENENENTNKAIVDNISFSESLSERIERNLSDFIPITDNIYLSNSNTRTINLVDSIAILDSISKSLSSSVNDSVSLGDTEDAAVLKSLVDSVTLSDSITNFGGKTILLTDSITVTDSIITTKQLNRFFAESVTVSDNFTKQSAQSIKLYDVIVSADNIDIYNPDAPELIGIIRLQGKRELFVYLEGKRDLTVNLQGKRELTIHLKGGLNMISNQNFSMISGDTKTIVIDIAENPVGASVKWSMKKRGAPTATLVKNGSIADGKIHIVLDKADTDDLSGLFVHECEVTDQSGNVSTVTTGSVNILADMI